MKYRRLGTAGLQVSELSYGSWATFGERIDKDISKELMYHSYDEGVNFFDNAETYAEGQSETIMGQILADAQWRRDSFIVSSKVYFGSQRPAKPNQTGLSRKHVIEACHQALARLQVDYLDLYFCHRPDPATPIEETVWAMHTLVQQGKILYWGTSEWSAGQIMQAYSIARQHHLVPPTMEQPQYNLFERRKVEQDYKNLYTSMGLGTTVWSPLASGVLTGKYNTTIPPNSRLALSQYKWLKDIIMQEQRWKLEKTQQLTALVEKRGLNLTQVAIAWCLNNPNVSTVILGATTKEQLVHNLKSAQITSEIDATLIEDIEAILQNAPEDSKL